MIISFFGHSNFCENAEIKKRVMELLNMLSENGDIKFYLGGYGGFDEFAYRCCKEFKSTHPETEIIFVTPYITEEYQRNRLVYVKEMYDSIIYPEIEDKPLRFAIVYRNRYIVENSDFIIAFVKYTSGGAYKAIRYAEKIGKAVKNLAVR